LKNRYPASFDKSSLQKNEQRPKLFVLQLNYKTGYYMGIKRQVCKDAIYLKPKNACYYVE